MYNCTDKKKILINGLSNNNGGIETVILNYCEIIVSYGYSVDFISYDETLAQMERIQKWDSKIIKITNRNNSFIKYYNDIKKVLSTGEYDIVWDNRDSLANLIFLSLAKRVGIHKRILHAHTSHNLGGKLKGYMHVINRNLLENIATDYWAVSKMASKYFFSKVNDKNIKIVPNCIDYSHFYYNEEFRKKIRLENNFSKKDKILLMVGALTYPKNQAHMILTFKHLKNNTSESWKLIIIGSGADKNELLDLCIREDINDVYFMGMVNNVNEWLSAADVYAMTSFNEGLPVALIEAQVSGLPCIISDTISTEAIISSNVYRVSLSTEYRKWADIIIKAQKNHSRNIGDNISDKFDINKQKELLWSFLISAKEG